MGFSKIFCAARMQKLTQLKKNTALYYQHLVPEHYIFQSNIKQN
jgi:hypothetical protein